MKKERANIIKEPQIRKIRYELRTLLNLWKANIIISLMDEASRYSKMGDERKSREIREKLSNLNLMFQLSICVYLHCGHSDKDMIYIPKMKQWLCIEYNSERIYYEKLRNELKMDTDEIIEFFDRLMGDEGIKLSRSRSSCHGYTYSKKNLGPHGNR